eukprot:3803112-Amphidinium_carterae.1
MGKHVGPTEPFRLQRFVKQVFAHRLVDTCCTPRPGVYSLAGMRRLRGHTSHPPNAVAVERCAL